MLDGEFSQQTAQAVVTDGHPLDATSPSAIPPLLSSASSPDPFERADPRNAAPADNGTQHSRLRATSGRARTARVSYASLHHNRRSFIGSSDARIIIGTDEARLVRLWREKRGEIAPEDLSDNLVVQLGPFTENLNRGWYGRNTGHR